MKRAAMHPNHGPSGRRGNAWAGPAKGEPPAPRPKIRAKAIRCPDCGAEPDQPCVKIGNGEPKTGTHIVRQRQALRAGLVDRRPEPRDPDQALPECPKCGQRITVTGKGLLRSHRVGGRNGYGCPGSGLAAP